jgi:hypothetical protein
VLLLESEEMPSRLEDIPESFRLKARLIFLSGPHRGRQIFLGDAPVTMGRGSHNSVVLADMTVAGEHCVVNRAASGFVLENCGGNALAVNGGDVAALLDLEHRDLVTVGSSVLEYRGPNIDPLTEDPRSTTLVPQPRFCFEATVCIQWEVTLGAHPECDFVLQGPEVQPRHARISFRDGAFFMEAVSGARVLHLGDPVTHAKIDHGSLFIFGQTPLEFDIDDLRCSVQRVDERPVRPAPPPLLRPAPMPPAPAPTPAPQHLPPAPPPQRPRASVENVPAPQAAARSGKATKGKTNTRLYVLIGLLVLLGFLTLAVAAVIVIFILI